MTPAKYQRIIEQSKELRFLSVNGRLHALTSINQERHLQNIPNPNYKGTGLALTGIVKRNQSIEDFKKDWIQRKTRQ